MAVGIDARALIDVAVFDHYPVNRFLQQQVQAHIAQALQELYARGDWIVAVAQCATTTAYCSTILTKE